MLRVTPVNNNNNNNGAKTRKHLFISTLEHYRGKEAASSHK